MKNTIVLITICLFLLICGILFWPTLYRYEKMTINGNSFPVKINRINGDTQYFVLGKWLNTKDNGEKIKSITIPEEEKDKITGNASLSYGSFSGKIYNGSNWDVTEITFLVKAIEKNGNLRWARKFISSVYVQPFATSSFNISVTGEEDIGSYEWFILEALGYKKNE